MKMVITVENFVKRIQENDLMYGLGCWIDDNPDLVWKMFETDEDYVFVDEQVDTKLIVDLFSRHFEGSEITFEPQILEELVEIQSMYHSVCEVFHGQMIKYEPHLDMGDEMSDLFVPLLNERFKKLFNVRPSEGKSEQ